MVRRVLHAAATILAATAILPPLSHARELTFEQRVKAQEAVERVYYSHQVGATKPFEEAVSRAVLEAKVEKYLKQSVALEEFWHTPVTAEMLQAEMERQARQTRMPDRLRALYAALGNDPLLVRECLARPSLVDRLTHNFFAFDGRLHDEARAEAEDLHRRLLLKGIEAFAADPRRKEVEIAETATGQETAEPKLEQEGEANRIGLSPEEFARWRGRAPRLAGEIGRVREEREAFSVSLVVEEKPGSARIASFTVPKRSWDEWWEETSRGLEAGSVRAAGGEGRLPIPAFGRELDSEKLATDPRASVDAVSSCLPGNTWDNGSLDAPPDAVGDHPAVWTGSLMVVWGGGKNPDFRNTGGRYDPVIDTWTATSTVDAPFPRGGHTAVWTGSVMVVWGGYANPPYLNTGGRYDPVSDTWKATSTVGAPSPRDGHIAVWTGSQMVVWGGRTSTPPYYVNTGGRYDPATDTWMATSTANAPEPRGFHTAVWTGSLMVVWGGLPPPKPDDYYTRVLDTGWGSPVLVDTSLV